LRWSGVEAVGQAGDDDAVPGRGLQHLVLAEPSPQHGRDMQSGVGGVNGKVLGQ
jgi:hypothetical protein